MEEQLISFKTAKLAKEKGFRTKNTTISFYDETGKLYNAVGTHFEDYYSAPQSLLQRWLREKHNYHTMIYPSYDLEKQIKYRVYEGIEPISSLNKDNYIFNYKGKEFDSYEEALEKILQKGLKIIE